MSTDTSELDEIKELVKENNQILKKLQSRARYAFVFSIIKYVVYIAIVIGLAAVMKPFVDQMLGVYASFGEGIDTVNEIKAGVPSGLNINSIRELFQ